MNAAAFDLNSFEFQMVCVVRLLLASVCGFAIGIERILLALTRQGLEKPDQPKDVYLGYAPGREHDAIQKAQELRADGKVVELALMCQDEADAREMQQTKGYESLVYLA